MSVIISTDDLEHTCPTCNGTGYIVVNDKKEPCSSCDGKGVILTELGKNFTALYEETLLNSPYEKKLIHFIMN